MKVLLFSVTAGGGHNATARAIAAMLTSYGAECEIVDAYRTAGWLMYHTVSKGYLLAASPGFRHIYGMIYRMCEKRKGNSFKSSAIRRSGRSLAKKFKKVIDRFDPDVIVCTHSFAARIVDITKERHGFRAKTVGIVTDFTMHPYWEEALRFDRIVLPHEKMIPMAMQKGFPEEKLLSLGIPIHSRFSAATQKDEARTLLGLDPALPTLLLMSGSMGHGNMAKALRTIDRSPLSFQMIVVCGTNRAARRRIERTKFRRPVLTLGYADNVPLLMDAADLIVSKPGGLTTSEALVKGLPMIICNPIPGHEDRNVTFLSACGTTLAAGRKLSLREAVETVFSDASRACAMREAIAVLRKPSALPDLCEEILRLAAEAQNEKE